MAELLFTNHVHILTPEGALPFRALCERVGLTTSNHADRTFNTPAPTRSALPFHSRRILAITAPRAPASCCGKSGASSRSGELRTVAHPFAKCAKE